MKGNKHELIIAYKNFFAIVEQHIDSLDSIMKAINTDKIPYSKEAFLYNFKKDFGITIKEYYSRRRFTRICVDIKTDKNILDIVSRYGYENQSSLNYVFKKYLNMNPTEYLRSGYTIVPFFIDMNDKNIENKILGLPYQDDSTQFFSALFEGGIVTKQEVKTRLFDYDYKKKSHDNFDILINKFIVKKYSDSEFNKIKVRTTRLNKNEKIFYDYYLHRNIINNKNLIEVNMKEVENRMFISHNAVYELIISLTRHNMEIESKGYISFINVFSSIDIVDNVAIVKVNL